MCNCLIGEYYEGLYDLDDYIAVYVYKSTDLNPYIKFPEIKNFNFCRDCGNDVKNEVALKKSLWIKTQKDKHNEKERIKRELDSKIDAFLGKFNLSEIELDKEYYIELFKNNKKMMIVWSLSTVRDYLKNNSFDRIRILELPTLDQIENELTRLGYKKRNDKFWYEYMLIDGDTIRGITIDKYSVYTGLMKNVRGCDGTEIYHFDDRITFPTLSDNLKNILKIEIITKVLLDQSDKIL